jgi:N-acetylmuramoyl-L-alanine amidase
MGRHAITNVWATRFADPVANRSMSRLVIEATALPSCRIRSVSACELRIDLPDSMLVMASDRIAVNDGLISRMTVAPGPPYPHVSVNLEHPSSWTVIKVPEAREGGASGRLVIDLDRSPIKEVFRGKLVAIDPGHGGSDIGGRGPVNLVEKKIALEIGRLLACALRREGAAVVMTRTSDEDVSKAARFARAESSRADVFISIHTFSSGNRKISGSRTLYSREMESESKALAECIQASLVEKLPVTDRGIARNPARLPSDFAIPYVVVEVAAITNWVDEGRFRSPTFKERAAEAMVTGLKRCFRLTAKCPDKCGKALNKSRTVPMEVATYPIRTHLIGENENLVEVIKRYTGEITKPGDVVVVAESVVAITQGRAILPESVHPGILARVLCKLPGKDGSLATPPAMQLAIDEVGSCKVMLGVVAAGVGRLIGRRGDFFRVAGHTLAQIDDIAGTCAPYDKHVILGPSSPDKVAKHIKDSLGVDIAIVDVNDLGCVDILGITDGTALDWVMQALASNPLGNDDQQTPIAILRPVY